MTYGNKPAPVAPPSTRMLTVVKWITFGVSVLLTGLAVLWVMQLQRNVEFLKRFDGMAERGSGDGKGLKGADDAIANAETAVVIGFVTLAAIVLLGVTALLTATGQQWARVLCVIMTLGPMGVVVYGVLADGPEALYALVFLIPFIALAVLWCLPGVSRGLAVKRLARAGATPHPGQPHPGQPHPGQPYPGQPHAGQSYPGQSYPEQAHPGLVGREWGTRGSGTGDSRVGSGPTYPGGGG